MGTRYYAHAGSSIAVRTPTAVTWLVDDHQGTATATVSSSAALTVTRRRTMPFGQDRGTAPGGWAGDKGFVGGTKDNTGLTHLGAREYDPGIGRFTSVDPVMDLGDPQQWSAYNYAGDSPVTNSDPSGLLYCSQCEDGSGQGSTPGGQAGKPPTTGGNTTGEGNQATGSPSGNVAQAVPVEKQKEKCGWFALVCNGFQRSMEYVHENQDTLGHIAIDLIEIDAGASLIGSGATLAAGGGIIEGGSGGILTVIAVPAAALGVTAIVAGGGLIAHGSSNLGKDLGDLHWNNQAAGNGGSAAGRSKGSLEGKREVVVDDPANPGSAITDIDHVEDGVLWEEKSATWAGDESKWVDKQVTKKLNSYVKARQHLPGYENAPIGIRFTEPNMQPSLRRGVEGAVTKFRQDNPGVDVRLEIP